ncbi:unnamed protein product [Caenorhabditis brenneri]
MADPPRHGFIKLEFPESASTRREMDEVVERLTARLEPSLDTYGIHIVKRHPTQIVEEQDCDCYFEVNYEVTSRRFNERLIDAMKEYLMEISGTVRYQLPNIVLHSPEFWETEIESLVRAIPLSAIYFGNVQGNTYLSHWEISFWDKLAPKSKKSKKDLPMFKIEVNFEFDKTDMITVNFQCQEEKKQNNNSNNGNNNTNNGNNRKMMIVNYQVTVRRESIRRIIVDPCATDCYGERIRIHLELNSPPLIRKGRIDEQSQSNPFHQPFYKRWKTFENLEWKNHGYPMPEAISDSPFFTLDFDETLTHDQIYRVLSRLRDRTRVSIEFGLLPIVNVPLGKRYPYNRWTIQGGVMKTATDENAAIYREFLYELFRPKYRIIDGKSTDVNEERKFAITYLIECLLSRGAVVKDQLLLNEIHWENFLNVIILYYKKNDKLCEAALEDLIHLIDGRKRIGCITKCLDKICQKRERMQLINGLSEKEIHDGFQIVRKVVFTPTRVIYVAPEAIMGNRVLRRFDKDGTKVLRITFRDDNNSKMRTNTTEELLEKTANKFFREGVRVANRDFGFLGCSNSQMRDSGAYFMLKATPGQLERFYKKYPRHTREQLLSYKPLIDEVRLNLGKFSEVENVPKMIARMGQCFTQSRLTGVALERKNYCKIFDYEGGKNSKKAAYTFSDGVGMMSCRFAKIMAQSMNYDRSVPSCFQIRFRGNKGVIAMEPQLDDLRNWSIRHQLDDLIPEIKVAFRPSQIKFQAKHIEGDQIEMVKPAGPVPVSLNKPLINILDQVSEMQGVLCHKRMVSRIEELMDRQVQSFAKQMNDETYCRNRLKEFPRRVDIDYLRTTWGFTLSREPFFRSLIKASIKFSITKQLRKEQIPIPKELGRTLFGVVDETGRLQYGQVFVQYSSNILNKHPVRLADQSVQNGVVVTGPILISKNPCIVPGDVRIFEAVDIPELHHMCDVVVFPQSGPRPHPDEMAGSDLDGDEYSVIWDPQMLLEWNEPAFDFSVEKQRIEWDPNEVDDLMREFYVQYLKLDSVGQISNAHLHNSDQYGLMSTVCMNLAKKNSQAVDFTKSGIPPADMTRDWRRDPITDEMVPPENPERIPDFHIGNERNPQYVSPRLCGRLFREFQAIDNVIKISEEKDELYDIEIDEDIMIYGYERFMVEARTELANYNGQLRSIMETYGIATEGEIMSGCIIEMRNRISDKDQDDMSFFNTNLMIETRVTTLICRFREKFFEPFGGYQSCCSIIENADENNSTCLAYRCRSATNSMMQKAVAWYRACYEFAQSNRETRKLSFAWIVYDVIAKVREAAMLSQENLQIGGANPMYTFLEKHRKQYLEDNLDDFELFQSLNQFKNDERAKRPLEILKMYFDSVPGLDSVLFMLYKWAHLSKLFVDQPIRTYQFFLIFILFATKQLPSPDVRLFEMVDEEVYREEMEKNGRVKPQIEEELTEEKKSHMMVKFLEYFASRNFRKLPSLSFKSLGYSSIFIRGEWQIYHVAAMKTYYNIMFNLRFEELPVSTDPTITKTTVIREVEPFVIELPEHIDIMALHISMQANSKVTELEMRRQAPKKESSGREREEERVETRVRYIVSARGTLESLQRLRQLTAVTIPIRSHLEGDDVSRQMAFLCHHKIMENFDENNPM